MKQRGTHLKYLTEKQKQNKKY